MSYQSPYTPDPNFQQPQGYYPNGHPQQQPGGYPPGWAPQQPQAYAQPAPAFARRDKLPGTALAASIMWIIYGGLGTIGGVLGLAGSGGHVQPSQIISLGLAIAFLMSGIQTLTGKLKGLLAPGITSIVIGSLTGIAFLLLGAIARGFHFPVWLFAIGVIIGGMLITAGILACIGNRHFKEWRATKGLY